MIRPAPLMPILALLFGCGAGSGDGVDARVSSKPDSLGDGGIVPSEDAVLSGARVENAAEVGGRVSATPEPVDDGGIVPSEDVALPGADVENAAEVGRNIDGVHAPADSERGGDGPDGGRAQLPIILSTRTMLPEQDPAFLAVEIAATRLILYFAAPPSLNFVPGDIVAGATNPGYLRRVESVSAKQNVYVLETTPAVLEDAIEQGSFDFTAGAEALSTSSAATDGAISMRMQPFEMQVDLKRDLANKEDRPPGIDIEVSSGSLRYVPALSIGGDIQRSRLTRLEVVASGQIDFSAVIRVSVEGRRESPLMANGEIEMDVAKSPYQVYWIGSFPLVAREVLTLKFGCSAAAQASATFGLTIATRVAAGLRYQDGKLDPVWESSSVPSSDGVDVGGRVEVGCYVRPKLQLELYGTVGPAIATKLGYEFAAEYPPCPLTWTLRGQVKAQVDLELAPRLFSRDLELTFSRTLFDIPFPVAAGQYSGLPGCEDAGIPPSVRDAGAQGGGGWMLAPCGPPCVGSAPCSRCGVGSYCAHFSQCIRAGVEASSGGCISDLDCPPDSDCVPEAGGSCMPIYP